MPDKAIAVVVVILFVLLVFVYSSPITTTPIPKACTMEAKQCPDGSYVGRGYNNTCEFFPCPSTSTSSTSTSTSAPTTTTSTAGAQIYGPANEISDVTPVYPNATLGTFSCHTNDNCVVVHTQHCFNNLASQQACINKNYSGVYDSYYRLFLDNASVVCAMYFVSANASCACINQGCSLMYRPE